MIKNNIKNTILKKYFLAGIDFLIDKNGDVYFIEANSSPGLLRFFEREYKTCRPIKDIKNTLKKADFLFIGTKNTNNDKSTKYYIKKIKEKFGNKNCKIKNIKNLRETTLIKCTEQILKLKSKPIIFTPFIKLKKILLENNYQNVINPYPVTNLTLNKSILYSKLTPTKNFKIPRSYKFETKAELKKIIINKKLKSFVIKPNFGQKGKDIQIINNLREIKNIHIKNGLWIVQEKIEVNKIENKFWDIRSFVINGKFSDCIGRISKNPVVNVCLGGEIFPIPKKIKIKIKKSSEDVIKQINKILAETK